MKNYLGLGVAAISGAAGYLAYVNSDLLSAIFVIFTVAWLGFRFTDGQRAWTTFSMFKNPFMMGLICFLAGFTYYTFKAGSFWPSLSFGLGIGILGIALGSFLWKYWNIG